jgi:hypothetical protein
MGSNLLSKLSSNYKTALMVLEKVVGSFQCQNATSRVQWNKEKKNKFPVLRVSNASATILDSATG